MKVMKSTLPNMILSLGLTTLVAGSILGGVYYATKKPIADAAAKAQVQAIADVAPPFDNNPEADAVSITADGGEARVYPALKGGRLVGAAVRTSSFSGFNGEISVMVGFDADGTVRNYTVLSHAETPGLGAKMGVWFRDPAGARSIIEKNPAEVSFFVTKDKEDNGQIDAITAATITSRAFLEAVRRAHAAFMKYKSESAASAGKGAES